MTDALDAVAAEAGRAPDAPVLVKHLHGRRWRFGQVDVRPARMRRYAQLADRVEQVGPDSLGRADALELFAMAEDMLRSALPAADRDAFDDAPFGGAEIGELITEYFAALGVEPGESAASPVSSSSTRRRSRPTSPRAGRR